MTDMRKLILLLPIAIGCFAFAQTSGNLTINQDPRLEQLLQSEDKTPVKGDSIYVEMPGYRVQIYSNNNPKKAKNEAFAAEKAFKEAYPDINVYVSYSAPFWKVRVGDFTTYYEALAFSRKLAKDQPKIAGEIFVMEEDYVRPVYVDLSTDSIPDGNSDVTSNSFRK